MLKISVCIAFCVAVCAGVYVAKGKCPRNEEYLLCGSECNQNCTVPNPGDCNDECIEGCFCMPGYVRNENGTCVNASECVTRPTCGVNEEFLPCGTACPATCTVPEPEICGLACSMGCFCKEGYYRDEVNHKCVTLDKCPILDMCFNLNEVYDICNASCEPSCKQPEPVCAKICKAGCICASGLLRSQEGDCVSVEKCTPINGTTPDVLTKYLNTINKILHFSN